MVEPVGIYSIASVANFLAPSSSQLFSYISQKYNKWRFKRRLFGLAVSSKGVTTLCQRLSNQNFIFLDLDFLFQKLSIPEDAVAQNKPNHPIDSYLCYPILRNHVVNIANVSRDKKIILTSKSLELLAAMPIYSSNLHLMALSKQGEIGMSILWENTEQHHENEIQKFRMVSQLKTEQITYYDSLQDLEKKCREYYRITESPI